MIASIRSRALPALLCALQVTLAVADTMPDSATPVSRNASVVDGSGKRWLSWGGLDGNAFLASDRNRENDSWRGYSLDVAGGRVGLTLGFGSVDARMGVGMAFSRLGMDELYLRLPFDILGWPSALQAGMFHWKDNPDAAMLGEYLARYQPYPASIRRHGQPWDSLGGLHGRVEGLRFAVTTPRGVWNLEALLLADSSYLGAGYDFSAVYTLDLRLPRGFEIGAGLENLGFATTQGGLHQPGRTANDGNFITDFVLVTTASDTAFLRIPAEILLSARVALDLRALFGREPRPDRSGRLFLETAILGWYDFAFYYGNRMDRLIWTAGTYLPSFGWLDVLCLQIEHQRLGSEAGAYIWNGIPSPVPTGNGEGGSHYVEARTPFPGRIKDWKWALLASKNVRSWLAVQIRYMDQPLNRNSYFLASDRELARDRSFYARLMIRY